VKFDVVLARAVAHVDILIPWMVSIVKKWGRLVLYKEYKEEEKQALLDLCAAKNLVIEKEHRYKLFDEDIERVIYVLG
jgi:16S rRNA G527 N7-methylase RsmG